MQSMLAIYTPGHVHLRYIVTQRTALLPLINLQ